MSGLLRRRNAPLGLLRELRTPSVQPWQHLTETLGEPVPAGRVRATFLGVSTVLLDDGHTAVLTDGFFSRPGVLRTFGGRVRPDRARIAAGLRRAGITELAAVFVAHSHHDHALDSAVVAAATGAQLLGSDSTARTAGALAAHRVTVVEVGASMTFGRFTLTALPAQHSPGDIAPGRIELPLQPPARAKDYRTGDCYSLHVTHGGNTLLIHASANYLPGALTGHPADTVYLGIGTLGKQSDQFRDAYWRETVTAVGASRVVPIHWDNFTRSLDHPLRPFPLAFDDFPTSMRFLVDRAQVEDIDLALPLLGRAVDPWPHRRPPRDATPGAPR